MVLNDGIAGVLPIFGRGRLGLPYPAEIYAIEADTLIIDYAIDQFKRAGIEEVYLVCYAKDLEWLAPILKFERRESSSYKGMKLNFVEVKIGVPFSNWSYLAWRGCKKVNWQKDFERFVIMNPLTYICDPDFISRLVSTAYIGCSTEIPNCFYVDRDTLKMMAENLRYWKREAEMSERDAWNDAICGNHFKESPGFISLEDWSGIYELMRRKIA